LDASATLPTRSFLVEPPQNLNVGGYNSRGFVEVLAASQTTTTKEWFQGTADAVRQYMWLFDEACRDGVEDFLILSGAHTGGLAWRCGRLDMLYMGAALSVLRVSYLARPACAVISEACACSCPRLFDRLCFDPPCSTQASAFPLCTTAGDHLYRMDYREFVQAHRAAGADITVAALPCAEEQAQAFGLMKIDDTGRIVEFAEKPKGDALKAMQVDTTILGLDADT
jgi:hypothetical protein